MKCIRFYWTWDIVNENPDKQYAAEHSVCVFFLWRFSFSLIYALYFCENCLSYLYVFENCTHTHIVYWVYVYCAVCTQCIVRAHNSQSILYILQLPSFIFNFPCLHFSTLASSLYFSICFSRIAIIDVLLHTTVLCWNSQHKRWRDGNYMDIYILAKEWNTHTHTQNRIALSLTICSERTAYT